jgi:Inward rectifier potassium channel C-terminal domain/Inward rectifier potassium channel transmembrane domain
MAVPLYRAMLDGAIHSSDQENDPLAQPLLEEGFDGTSHDPLWPPPNGNSWVPNAPSNVCDSDDTDRKRLRKSQRRVSFSDETDGRGEREDPHYSLRQRKPPAMSRLLDRNPDSSQSRSLWNTQLVGKEKARRRDQMPEYRGNDSFSGDHNDPPECPVLQRSDRHRYASSFWNSWFYTLAYQRTVVLIVILFLVYFALVAFFALLYFSVSRIGAAMEANDENSNHHQVDTVNIPSFHMVNATLSFPSFIVCDMDLHEPMEAMYFSLSTMASIGYGVSDYYFGKCVVPFVLVLMQICTAICFDAIAIGLLFQRIRRSHKRSKTIVFTNSAVAQRIRNVPHLMIRIAELRRYPLLNATVRAYCIRHERYLCSTKVRDDPSTDVEANRDSAAAVETIHFVTRPMKLQMERILMNIPQVIVHRMDHDSPLCPPSVWYDQHGKKYHYPIRHCTFEGTDRENRPEIHDDKGWMDDTQARQQFMQDRHIEVVVVVEGTDELTGTCTQTKQSYTHADVRWNAQWVPCIFPSGTPSATCVIDFSLFHAVEDAPGNSEDCPYIH